MRFAFYASQPHYAEHLVPIWAALDPLERGPFHASGAARGTAGLAELAPGVPRPSRGAEPVLVASYRDARAVRGLGRPIVLVEHGAGQTYSNRHPSYAGGTDRADISVFLCPSERVAALNRAAYPGTASVVVGVPKLDRWHRAMLEVRASGTDPRRAHNPEIAGSTPAPATTPTAKPRGPVGAHPTVVPVPGRRGRAVRTIDGSPGGLHTVAVSFHWDWDTGPPEARWAFPHYRDAVLRVAQRATIHGSWFMIGHGHPRAWRQLRPFYEAAGIEAVENFEEVLDRADVYACDNSSTLYEFASLDRPVVVLNAPWYRREVEHGLRFWTFADVGVQVDEARDLSLAVALALSDPPAVAQRRREVVGAVYAAVDGQASMRAVDALRDLREHLMSAPGRRLPDPAWHTRHPPVARFRRLGATESQIDEITAEWAVLDTDARVAAQDALAAQDDAALRAQLEAMRGG